ncbi:MAG: alpha/beta hydrolase, partial [Clostridia bacterium]
EKATLDASFYYNAKVGAPKALLVFCHGIGCGRQNYLNRIDYFAKKGYLIFAFDLTGCVNSGGKSLYGLPQATNDIRSALLYVNTIEKAKDLPRLLYGHSWSGYSCAALMNEQDYGVDAIVTCSGFDSTYDIAIGFMTKKYAFFKTILAHYFQVVEVLKFGKIAKYKAIDGINKFGKPVIVAHSKDDPSIPFEGSIYGKQNECTNPYAKFLCFEGRGHTLSRPLKDEQIVNKSFVKDGSFRKLKHRESFFKYNVDMHYAKAEMENIYGLDTEFMDGIDKFYDNALQQKK